MNATPGFNSVFAQTRKQIGSLTYTGKLSMETINLHLPQ